MGFEGCGWEMWICGCKNVKLVVKWCWGWEEKELMVVDGVGSELFLSLVKLR